MDNVEILEATIDKYLARLDEQATEEARMPKLRTPLPSVDIDGFFRLVDEALVKQQQIDGAKNQIFFTEEYPEKDENIKGEVIAYSLLERKPGTFERTTAGSAMNPGNIRQRKKFFRESIVDPEIVGFNIYTYGQWFDNRIEFDIIAKNNKTANMRALWFEDFMDSWTWFFEASGVSSLFYEGRGEDKVVTIDNKKRAVRPLIYYVRTEKITVIRENTLRSLLVTSSLD